MMRLTEAQLRAIRKKKQGAPARKTQLAGEAPLSPEAAWAILNVKEALAWELYTTTVLEDEAEVARLVHLGQGKDTHDERQGSEDN